VTPAKKGKQRDPDKIVHLHVKPGRTVVLADGVSYGDAPRCKSPVASPTSCSRRETLWRSTRPPCPMSPKYPRRRSKPGERFRRLEYVQGPGAGDEHLGAERLSPRDCRPPSGSLRRGRTPSGSSRQGHVVVSLLVLGSVVWTGESMPIRRPNV
jgi:hypothetical protein